MLKGSVAIIALVLAVVILIFAGIKAGTFDAEPQPATTVQQLQQRTQSSNQSPSDNPSQANTASPPLTKTGAQSSFLLLLVISLTAGYAHHLFMRNSMRRGIS